MKHLKTINELFDYNDVKKHFDKLLIDNDISDTVFSNSSEELLEIWSKYFHEKITNFLNLNKTNHKDNIDFVINNFKYVKYILFKNNLNIYEILDDNSEIFNSEPFPVEKKNDLGRVFLQNNLMEENIKDIELEIEKLFKKNPTRKEFRILLDSINDIFKKPILVDLKLDLLDYIKNNKKDKALYNSLICIHLVSSINIKFLQFLEYDNIEDFRKEKEKSKVDKNTKIDIKKLPPVPVKTFKNKKTSKEKLDNKIERYIKDLHPKAQDRFRHFLIEISNMGFEIVLTSGYRDFFKQYKLKKKNKKNASAGHSTHNYGIAIDFNVIDSNKKWYKKSTPKSQWLKTGIPQLAEELGFRWGGSFKTYYDPIHFDLAKEYSVSKMRKKAIQESGQDNITYNEIDWTKVQGNKVEIA